MPLPSSAPSPGAGRRRRPLRSIVGGTALAGLFFAGLGSCTEPAVVLPTPNAGFDYQIGGAVSAAGGRAACVTRDREATPGPGSTTPAT